MGNIQIGIDLATSLSLIAAAIAFIHNLRTQAGKTREQNRKAHLIRSRERVINDIIDHLEGGVGIVRQVRAAQAGRELTITADSYAEFCMQFHEYIELNAAIKLLLWGDEADREILDKMKRLLVSWNASFVEAASRRQLDKIPDFGGLVDQLSQYTLELSANLRRAVEAA